MTKQHLKSLRGLLKGNGVFNGVLKPLMADCKRERGVLIGKRRFGVTYA